MIRRCFLLCVACAFALSVSACGSDSDSGGPAIDPASVVTQDAITQAFTPPEDVAIHATAHTSKVTYSWSYDGEETPLPHCSGAGETMDTTTSATIVVRFESVQSQSTDAINGTWDTQNQGQYANDDLQEIANVGNKATWVLKGQISNGELRVATDHYLFYIRIQSNWAPIPCPGQSHEFFTEQDAIAHATALGKSIVENLQAQAAK